MIIKILLCCKSIITFSHKHKNEKKNVHVLSQRATIHVNISSPTF